jgi:hypothetical protein
VGRRGGETGSGVGVEVRGVGWDWGLDAFGVRRADTVDTGRGASGW